MKKLIALILLILLTTFTTQLLANEYSFPRGIDSVIDGEKVRCYNLDEYKTVAKVFVLYDSYKNENILLINKISELEDINYELKLMIDIKNENIELMSGNMFGSRFKAALPWVIVIVESIALSVVSVYSVVK